MARPRLPVPPPGKEGYHWHNKGQGKGYWMRPDKWEERKEKDRNRSAVMYAKTKADREVKAQAQLNKSVSGQESNPETLEEKLLRLFPQFDGKAQYEIIEGAPKWFLKKAYRNMTDDEFLKWIKNNPDAFILLDQGLRHVP
jgi:hypothetical protein